MNSNTEYHIPYLAKNSYIYGLEPRPTAVFGSQSIIPQESNRETLIPSIRNPQACFSNEPETGTFSNFSIIPQPSSQTTYIPQKLPTFTSIENPIENSSDEIPEQKFTFRVHPETTKTSCYDSKIQQNSPLLYSESNSKGTSPVINRQSNLEREFKDEGKYYSGYRESEKYESKVLGERRNWAQNENKYTVSASRIPYTKEYTEDYRSPYRAQIAAKENIYEIPSVNKSPIISKEVNDMNKYLNRNFDTYTENSDSIYPKPITTNKTQYEKPQVFTYNPPKDQFDDISYDRSPIKPPDYSQDYIKPQQYKDTQLDTSFYSTHGEQISKYSEFSYNDESSISNSKYRERDHRDLSENDRNYKEILNCDKTLQEREKIIFDYQDRNKVYQDRERSSFRDYANRDKSPYEREKPFRDFPDREKSYKDIPDKVRPTRDIWVEQARSTNKFVSDRPKLDISRIKSLRSVSGSNKKTKKNSKSLSKKQNCEFRSVCNSQERSLREKEAYVNMMMKVLKSHSKNCPALRKEINAIKKQNNQADFF
ncbi:hypothetical protein SteCoe_11917 [Stentor coeruleus]|uniref:Uncharacterized protein n=1 Tax=Stentor coeruleus TaxID=5963 RepID=A0A1R2CC68_9CILI|nr:hypothetical protein SteCoe_11917 [Stentor coeruleus]